MKEIGGYFGLEETGGAKEYYSNLLCFNTARNALAFLCKARGIQKIYIPDFMCDTAAFVLDREGVSYEYYRVKNNFTFHFEHIPQEGDYIYLVNYYGQLTESLANYLPQTKAHIILDNVQAFFQEPILHVDTIYSCRKFFGVPDGAYLATDLSSLNPLYANLPVDDSSRRLSHIYGRIQDGASAHFAEYQALEEHLYDLPIQKMSPTTHSLLQNIDYLNAKKKREENYRYLYNQLQKSNALSIVKEDIAGPYCFPYQVENGPLLRKKLIEQKIYVSTLWPNVQDGIAATLAQNILPLPCDQRYGLEDMALIVNILQN